MSNILYNLPFFTLHAACQCVLNILTRHVYGKRVLLCIPIGGRPDMVKLQFFPGPYGPLNIPEQIGIHYKEFGHLLLNDRSGAVVSGLELAHLHNPVNITRAILQRWLERQPTELTWSGLVKCLRSIGLETLASDIDSCLVD